MKKTVAILAMTISAALAFAGTAHAQQKTMSIGTGGTGGVYYPLGGAIANVLSKSLPNTQATAEVTGGSVDNLKLIASGQSEIGFSMADAALDALKGEDKFKSGKVPLQTLLVVYPNRMHVVTVEGTGIETMADLKGKRVSTGSPGSATEVMAFRVHRGRRPRQGQGHEARAARRRRIRQRHQGSQDRRVLLGRRHADRRRHRSRRDARHEDEADRPCRPGRQDERQVRQALCAGQDQASVYPGIDKDNDNTEVWNIIVTGDKMSDEDAYNIVKTLVEKKADIVAVHKEAESFSLDNQVQDRSPVPFHPGALKYFKEKGIGGRRSCPFAIG